MVTKILEKESRCLYELATKFKDIYQDIVFITWNEVAIFLPSVLTYTVLLTTHKSS